MKKVISVILSIVLTMSVFAFSFSANAEELSANVNVSISTSKGVLNMACVSVRVTDEDGDGVLTINDALYCAHEQNFDGGASSGYKTKAVSGYDGLSLTKLWGKSGSFAYYLNNTKAWSLTDEVKGGDHVYAFAYSDTIGWSDKYSFFDTTTATIEPNEKITLTLSYYNKLTGAASPVVGAVITVDGVPSEFATDAEGKVEIDNLPTGTHIISAKSPTGKTITPPVCKLSVKYSVASYVRYVYNYIFSIVNSIFSLLYNSIIANDNDSDAGLIDFIESLFRQP